MLRAASFEQALAAHRYLLVEFCEGPGQGGSERAGGGAGAAPAEGLGVCVEVCAEAPDPPDGGALGLGGAGAVPASAVPRGR